MKEDKNHLYIMLSMTGTLPATAIYKCTKKPYSHTSFSFDRKLHHMYSFGRYLEWNAFYAGFVQEVPDRCVYRRFPEATCRVIEIDVTPEQYMEAKHIVRHFVSHGKRFRYNNIGLLLAEFNKFPYVKNQFFCSQFAAFVLEKIGCKFIDKPYLSVTPDDFYQSDKRVIFEGKLRDYWNEYCVEEGYSKY